MKLKLILVSILCCCTAHAGDLTGEIVSSDKYLTRVKEMIQQEKKQISELTDAKRKAAKELKKAELELRYHKNITDKLEKKLYDLNKDLRFIHFQKTKFSKRIEELEEDIRSANFYLAGAGETELLEALILGDELIEVTAGMQIISRVDNQLFTKVRELELNRSELDTAAAQLETKQEEIKSAVSEKNASLKEYQSKKTMVKQLYKMAAEDEKIKKEYIAMLAKRQNQLERKLKELEILRAKQQHEDKFDGLYTNIKNMQGKLQWPLKGEIIERFGTKKVEGFKGVIHKKGIKIKPAERLVSSVFDGVVMHSDSAWGLGYFVIVEHFGGYYTLYANMDNLTVETNQKVHAGEILGTIDIDQDVNTPYLYFEIRIHDKAVNPLKWLSS